MDQQSVHWELLMLLAQHYEDDCSRFVVIPQPLMETYLVRSAIAELRGDKYIEELVRGVIHLNPRGYLTCQKELLGFDRCASD